MSSEETVVMEEQEIVSKIVGIELTRMDTGELWMFRCNFILWGSTCICICFGANDIRVLF